MACDVRASATRGSTTFLPDLSRGCVGPVKTEITLGGDAGRVDFQDAVGTEDGIARPMKPALATAPILVSPGTRAADTLRPPAGCLGTAALTGDKDQVTVEVPYTVAGTPAWAMWVRQRTRQPVEPRVLLARIPAPPPACRTDGAGDGGPVDGGHRRRRHRRCCRRRRRSALSSWIHLSMK